MEKILVVDDEANMRLVLSALLKKGGYEVVEAENGLEALRVLKAGDVDVVVTDLRMPKLDGMGLLEEVVEDYPSTPVIMITAHGTVATAVDAMKKGAFDYITKPFDQNELKRVIRKALKTSALNEEELVVGPGEIDRYGIIGSSKPMLEVYEAVKRVAPTTTTVLLTGETGTGKDLIAQAIHRNSPRKDNPFIKINCAAIAETLIESELFGYEKGAFTGAGTTKPGRFELAHKGTLFLDEAGDIPKDMQVKLLRVLEDQEFERVGGLKTIKVDVRLVAATNRNLLQDVKEGRFREDLFYRLNVFPIRLPPLRERREDIVPLAEYFLEKFNGKHGRSVRHIDNRVKELLVVYDWPGNVRELEHMMERVVLMAKDDTVTPEDVPEEVRFRQAVPPEKTEKPFKEFIKSRTEEVEKQLIVRVLEECGGNVTRAAQQLGFSRKGLQLKMIKYNLRKRQENHGQQD
ncbi:MAG: sigma-54-dependent Fis family transcriptional regulator [Syntrophobacterales bacterium]|nr:sigma-54-dependent Fis family transcriptional regulator [Syntrophobacterales bacterium]